MGKSIIRFVLLTCFILPMQLVYAQSGVGIGTSSPNPNAALDIQSSANDKGILIPRLTSTQRLAMNSSLSATENGLLVFDSDIKEFFYWNNTIWTSISVIQDLQLIGNSLSITKNGSATIIDLSPFSGTNTDNQDLSSSSSGNNRTIDITGGNSTTFNVADNDNNAANELQTISKTGSTVTLSNGGGSFTDAVNDADANASNELQTISKTGSTVTLSNGGGSFVDDDTDADADPTNELQTISKAGSTVTLSNGGGSFTDAVNDADANASNELQTISKTGSTVTLSNGGGSFSVNDGDSSSTNEIQTLSFSSPNLTISGGNSVTLPPAGIAKEAFKAYLGKTVTINNIVTAVLFDIKLYDINNNYDNGAGAYTAPVRGIYHFNGLISVNTGSLPTRVIISVGGVNVYDKQIYPGNNNESVGFASDILLNKGDVVGIILFVTDAKSFNINGGREFTYVAGRLVIEL